ncbi:MAG TPA: cytochrome c biogenesis protein ResB [Pyrinomonadaceae bacterium]|jgi:cytochrome c biogenesis protein|nr:cytochrome c biogenesis protein ResB [Pyrinomonadaceae bacterium]
MSTAEETLKGQSAAQGRSAPVLNRVLDFLSSVRVGVVQLCILVVFAMIGMLIVQQNVNGFDSWFIGLTPAEKTVFGYLGFFDIYHSWYFNLILLSLSLNIILASIDRFPSAWSYIVEPKLTATRDWLLGRKEHKVIPSTADEKDIEAKITAAFKNVGLRVKSTPQVKTEYGIGADGRKDFANVVERRSTVIFGQSGSWNRLGAYVIHVFLLTLFLGHFVAFQTGFDADVRMIPGEKTDEIQLIQFNLDKKEKFSVKLPFTIDCTDIQQRLIDENGGIDVTNTLDWRTQIRVDDPAYGSTLADVSLNKPFTYRGYRFFQAQTIPVGNARIITLELTPQNGGAPINVEIQRNGSATLADGTKIDFKDFEPDFTFGENGQPDTRSAEYNNPAAILNVTPPGEQPIRVFAFAQKLPDSAPVGAPKAGYKWHLATFEKSPLAHILSIKYDPFNAHFIAWYIGGFGLVGTLMLVFFFSHKRVWASIEPREDGSSEVVIGGEANRNHLGFADKFKKIADEIRGIGNGD